MGSPAIPPPPAPAPDDVNPDLGPASQGSGSKMDQFRAIINHLSGGGTPAIQERLAADFAKRQHDAELYRQNAKQAATYLTHANATKSNQAPFGIHPQTGQPATAQDIQQWQNNLDTSQQAYQKLLPKDAKPIAQKLGEVVEHAIGRKGQHGAPAGQSSAPLQQAGPGGSTIPPPPQGAAQAGGSAGPSVPPPPNSQPPPAGAQPATPSASANPMEIPVPVSMSAQTLGAPELQRMTGVQNALAQKKAELGQEMKSSVTTFDPTTGTMGSQAISGTGEPIGTPIKNTFPAKLLSPGMIHPVSIVGPDGQPIPALQNKFTKEIYDQEGNVIPNAKIFSAAAQVGRQSVSTDPFGNVTTTTRKPIVGGTVGAGAGKATPSGGAAATPRSAGGGGRMVLPPPLDADGHIPETATQINTQVRENANQLLDGQDVTKLPAKVRTPASALARQYGWEQGKFTPKEQTQVREASTFIQDALNSPALAALDEGTLSKAPMIAAGQDVSKHGFLSQLALSAGAQRMSPQQAEMVRIQNQLVGTIAGLSKLVRPGGTTEAQIERLKNELPNLVTTQSSADARARLLRLQKEIDIAMAKGSFGQLGAAEASAPKANRPGSLPPPPAGGKKQFYRLNGKFYDAATRQEIPAQGARP